MPGQRIDTGIGKFFVTIRRIVSAVAAEQVCRAGEFHDGVQVIDRDIGIGHDAKGNLVESSNIGLEAIEIRLALGMSIINDRRG